MSEHSADCSGYYAFSNYSYVYYDANGFTVNTHPEVKCYGSTGTAVEIPWSYSTTKFRAEASPPSPSMNVFQVLIVLTPTPKEAEEGVQPKVVLKKEVVAATRDIVLMTVGNQLEPEWLEKHGPRLQINVKAAF